MKKLERNIKHIDEKIDKYMQDLEDGDLVETCDRKPTAQEIEKRVQKLKNRKGKYETYQKQLSNSEQYEISTTDTDARLMCNNNNNVDVSYNVQKHTIS